MIRFKPLLLFVDLGFTTGAGTHSEMSNGSDTAQNKHLFSVRLFVSLDMESPYPSMHKLSQLVRTIFVQWFELRKAHH